MSSARIATWTWSLIFGGMLVMALGLTLVRTEVWLGAVLIGVSAIAFIAGLVLIWVRSTMKEP